MIDDSPLPYRPGDTPPAGRPPTPRPGRRPSRVPSGERSSQVRPAGRPSGMRPVGPAAVADPPVDRSPVDRPPVPAGGRTRGDLVRELRDGAADRIPVPVRAVPWRAAVLALVLAVTVATALLARAHGTAQDVGPTVAARSATAREAPSAARPPGRPSGAGSVGVVPPSPGAPVPGIPAAGNPPDGTPATGVGSLGAGADGAGADGAGADVGGAVAPRVVVHVTGRVRRPGLVRLPVGSRVWDAVAAAGGAAAGARLDRINLARPLQDGEQIVVPDPDDPVPAPGVAGGAGGAGPGAGAAGGGAAGAGPAGAPVDLNAATAADLDGLPGVGPVLAGRILAWRTQHGRFSRVEELGEVPGIGDKLLAQLTPLVRV